MDISKCTRDNLIIAGMVFIIVLLIFVAYGVTKDQLDGDQFRAKTKPTIGTQKGGVTIAYPNSGTDLKNRDKIDIIVTTQETSSIILVETMEFIGGQQVCSRTDRCIYSLNAKALHPGNYTVIAVSIDMEGNVHTDKIFLKK